MYLRWHFQHPSLQKDKTKTKNDWSLIVFYSIFVTIKSTFLTSYSDSWMRAHTSLTPYNPLIYYTLYTLRKPLQHLLATGVPSFEEPGSAHEQTCKVSREEPPHPIKQRRDELRKRYFFVSLSLWWRLLILVDSCAEWGWPDTLKTIQRVIQSNMVGHLFPLKNKCIFFHFCIMQTQISWLLYLTKPLYK